MPKVSIVMPTYNVEKYFRQCIESVINQTLKDIEIIPVDDGSPDNCGRIMDEYAKKDPRIKPIHKENGGYGSAVNMGIEKATGEYIAILETDDWVEPDMYELLYNQAKSNDADITKCSFYIYNSFDELQNIQYKEPHKIIENAPTNVFNITEYPILLSFHASVWAALYKSSFIKEIKFIEKEAYQDFPFHIEVLCKANRISVLKKYLVHYRSEEGQNSSTNRRDEKLLYMAINTINGKNILKQYNLFNELKESFFYHAFSANYDFYNKIEFKYKKRYAILLKELFSDIKFDNTFKYIYFNIGEQKFVKNILNKSLTSIMIYWYYKIIKSFFIHKYDHNKYEIIRVLGFIKITRKTARLEIVSLNNHISVLNEYIEELNKKIDYLVKENDKHK